jgi:hypothetical protein
MTELREKLNSIVEEKNIKVIPENLKVGAEAFGVQGTFTSDATATAEDIAKDKTAYVNGEKVVGILEASSGGGEYNAKMLTEALGVSSGNNFWIINNVTELPEEIQITNNTARSLFENCKSLTKIPKLLPSTPIKNAQSMYSHCETITEIQEIDTSQVLYFTNMCNYCYKLVTVPKMSAAGVTQYSAMQNMYKNCNSLSDESLNNIMDFCISAVNFPMNYTGYTKLSYLGLTQDQATRCQSLSNYQAFLNAGWQTGF